MKKEEYEELENTANHLQRQADETWEKESIKAKNYRDGYVRGVEDLLKCIRTDNINKANQ